MHVIYCPLVDLVFHQEFVSTTRGPPVVVQTRPKGGCQTAMPGESAGDGMSGRRIILQRWIQDRNPSPQVHLILRGYIKCQNVSRRGSLNWKQLLRLATEWHSRNVQIAVARTHYLWRVGTSVRPDTILRREKLRRE